MARKNSFLLTGLITLSALGVLTLLLTAPSWSSPALLFVNTPAPESLPVAGDDLTLRGSGFSPTTRLWLVPEPSIRSATTATLETYGTPYHFISRDDHLYAANGAGGFFIVQGIQSPVPIISGTLDNGGQGIEIVLHRETALLAAGSHGLQVIDIRDDSNPQLLSALKSLAPALSVANSGKIVYVARGKSGVEIVDIADPRQPRRLGALPDIAAAYKLYSDEKVLIIATANGGWIYDITQPAQPRRLAALPVPGGPNTVMTRRGETLYWATKSAQEGYHLYTLDMSQPSAPRRVDSAPLSGVPYGISCCEEQLAVALGSSGTQLFARGAEHMITASATIAAKVNTRYALLLGTGLWIADSDGELLRLDQQKAKTLTAAPVLPNLTIRINPIVTPELFFFGDKNGLSIFARWDETAPVLLAHLPISGLTQQYLSADQRQLWLATQDKTPSTTGKLVSVDISLPHAPRITSEISLSHFPVIIGEHGTTLVITTPNLDQAFPYLKADRLDSLHLIDTAEAHNPALVSTYPLRHVSTGLTMTEELIVLMQTDGLLRVIDISTTDGPQEVGTLQMPWLHTAAWMGRVNIAVKDHVAFISSPLGKIFLIDLQDPRRPEYLGDFTLAGPVKSLLIDDYLLLAEVNKEGLVVIDLKISRAPEILGTIPLPGRLHRLTVQGEKIWYSHDDSNGVYSLPLPRHLQNSGTDQEQITAHLAQPPPPGAYRLWLTDKGKHLLLPGVSWSSPNP